MVESVVLRWTSVGKNYQLKARILFLYPIKREEITNRLNSYYSIEI